MYMTFAISMIIISCLCAWFAKCSLDEFSKKEELMKEYQERNFYDIQIDSEYENKCS